MHGSIYSIKALTVDEIRRAANLPVNTIVFDVEDFIAASQRNIIPQALEEVDFAGKKLAIRVNSTHSDMWSDKSCKIMDQEVEFIEHLPQVSAVIIPCADMFNVPYLSVMLSDKEIWPEIADNEAVEACHSWGYKNIGGLIFSGGDYYPEELSDSQRFSANFSRAVVADACKYHGLTLLEGAVPKNLYSKADDASAVFERECNAFKQNFGCKGVVIEAEEQIEVVNRTMSPFTLLSSVSGAVANEKDCKHR